MTQVRDRDRGAKRLIRGARALQSRAAVEVGVLGKDAAAPYDGGVTVAMVAAWAEYGLGQPQRSWLRGWIDENEAAVQERLRTETREVLAGRRSPEQAVARIGVWIVGEIQARIAAGIAPPNAQSTVDRKGSSTPLIDKGQFRSSITSRVVR